MEAALGLARPENPTTDWRGEADWFRLGPCLTHRACRQPQHFSPLFRSYSIPVGSAAGTCLMKKCFHSSECSWLFPAFPLACTDPGTITDTMFVMYKEAQFFRSFIFVVFWTTFWRNSSYTIPYNSPT